MKKILMLSMVFLFLVGSINAQGVRDDDSYRIDFNWSNSDPIPGSPGGWLFENSGHIILTAARTSSAFNVYAKNNSPDAETGDPIEDHSAWPSWYLAKDWDTPDADPAYQCGAGDYECNAPFYLLTIDTFQEKWWLFYSQYPNQAPSNRGVASLYVPMSGDTHKVTDNGDGIYEIEITEDGGDWKTLWAWGFEDVKLQNRHFVVHLDRDAMNGSITPEQLLE